MSQRWRVTIINYSVFFLVSSSLKWRKTNEKIQTPAIMLKAEA